MWHTRLCWERDHYEFFRWSLEGLPGWLACIQLAAWSRNWEPLESDWPGSELQNGHGRDCDMGIFHSLCEPWPFHLWLGTVLSNSWMCDELSVQCLWHLYIWCSINANIITSGRVTHTISLPKIVLSGLQSLRNLVPIVKRGTGQWLGVKKKKKWMRITELCFKKKIFL